MEYQETVSAQIKARAHEEANSIDGVMKAKAEKFKELGTKTAQQNLREETLERQNCLIKKYPAQRPHCTKICFRKSRSTNFIRMVEYLFQ